MKLYNEPNATTNYSSTVLAVVANASCIFTGVYSPTEPTENSEAYSLFLVPGIDFSGTLSVGEYQNTDAFDSSQVDSCNGLTCNASMAWSAYYQLDPTQSYWLYGTPGAGLLDGSANQIAYYFWQAPPAGVLRLHMPWTTCKCQ